MRLLDTAPSLDPNSEWSTEKVASVMGSLGYFKDVAHTIKYPRLVDTLTSILSDFNLTEEQLVPCIELIEKIYHAIELYEIDLTKPDSNDLELILRCIPVVEWVMQNRAQFPGIADEVVQQAAYNLLNFEYLKNSHSNNLRNTDLGTFGSFADLGPAMEDLNRFKSNFEA